MTSTPPPAGERNALARLGHALWPGERVAFVPFPATPTGWATTYGVRLGDARAPQAVVRCIDPTVTRARERRVEVELAEQLSAAGIGPRVLHADRRRGIVVMQALPPRTARGCDLEQALWVAELLRRLHRLAPRRRVRLHVSKRRRFLRRVPGRIRAGAGLEDYRRGLERYQELRRLLRRGEAATALCHNDLNPTNILLGPERAWLIDFDHVGMGDPLFDVATAVEAIGLDGDAAGAFVTHYLGRLPRPAERERLELLACLALLRYGLDALTLVRDVAAASRAAEGGDGEPFVLRRAEGETLDAAVLRLSRAFLDAGLARADAGPARAAARNLEGRP